jgi:hypothetical protein
MRFFFLHFEYSEMDGLIIQSEARIICQRTCVVEHRKWYKGIHL